MYACMTPVGFDTSDKFENHCSKSLFSVRGMEGSVSSKKKVCSANFQKKNSTF